MSKVTSRTLRHYDAVGLLAPAWVADNGRRYYEREQLVRLQQILLLRELGLAWPCTPTRTSLRQARGRAGLGQVRSGQVSDERQHAQDGGEAEQAQCCSQVRLRAPWDRPWRPEQPDRPTETQGSRREKDRAEYQPPGFHGDLEDAHQCDQTERRQHRGDRHADGGWDAQRFCPHAQIIGTGRSVLQLRRARTARTSSALNLIPAA